ncbi:LysR substrate-binding domain-containing protein [Hoeflea sp. TYP-13]|uniref:LysR substrate-binding domain-containing protein n=1 Tax=Hoeflea sp. TYP-13 TaxID=3230023 RepID=UPI0034C65BCA
MAAPLDIDQLRTFIAIVDMGSFTRAATEVNKTQSAVSMQMRRLEERVGKSLFEKDGRINRLTSDGERLLAYARRLVRLNNETLAAFDEEALAGTIRLGTPDDYADRYMPDIIARFAKTNPNVELTITCEPSKDLVEKLNRNELDIALVTHNPKVRNSILVRSEPLLWVTSMAHSVHAEVPVPLAVGRRNCDWRQLGCAALDSVGREYSVLFTSWSSTVVASAVLAGLAVSLLPESALRPGMRILTPADGFPALPPAEIGMIRRPGVPTVLMDAITDHIAASLDNMTSPDEENDSRSGQRKSRNRSKSGLMFSSW